MEKFFWKRFSPKDLVTSECPFIANNRIVRLLFSSPSFGSPKPHKVIPDLTQAILIGVANGCFIISVF